MTDCIKFGGFLTHVHPCLHALPCRGTALTLGKKEVSGSVRCRVERYTNVVFGTAKCVLFIEVSSFQGSSSLLHVLQWLYLDSGL